MGSGCSGARCAGGVADDPAERGRLPLQPRRCGGVEPILEQLSHRPGLAWAYEAWQWSCALPARQRHWSRTSRLTPFRWSLRPTTSERSSLQVPGSVRELRPGLAQDDGRVERGGLEDGSGRDRERPTVRRSAQLERRCPRRAGRGRASFSGLSDRAPTGRRWPSPHPATGAGPGSSEMASR